MELVYGSASCLDPFYNTALCNLNRLFEVIDIHVTSLYILLIKINPPSSIYNVV